MSCMIDISNFAGEQLVLSEIRTMNAFPSIEAMRDVVTVLSPNNYLLRKNVQIIGDWLRGVVIEIENPGTS